VFADVEEAETEVAHQPLVSRAGGEIDAAGADVDRDGTGRLDDVGVDVGAVGVREIAHRLEIVLEAVVHRYQRDLDQLRLAIHDPLEVLEIDAAVARRDHPEIEALLLQLHQVDERALEVQRVGDDVTVELPDTEALDHQVLAGAGVRDVADLG